MSTSRVFEDYTITTQLMEESGAFYVQFYNTLLHKKYEANVAYDTLGLPGKPAEVFNVLNYCLDKKEGYNFGFALNGSIMGVMFDAKIGGVLSVSFAITLNEISVSGDTVVSYKLNELETELKEVKEELETTKEELAEVKEELKNIDAKHTKKLLRLTQSMIQMETTIGHLMGASGVMLNKVGCGHLDSMPIYQSHPLNTTTLTLSNRSNTCHVDWTKLNRLPNLTKLTVVSHAITGFLEYASSSSLTHLIIGEHVNTAPATFNWITRFPNLESIDTKEIPNLTNILDFLPDCPKLKRIRIFAASTALTRYCVANGIELE